MFENITIANFNQSLMIIPKEEVKNVTVHQISLFGVIFNFILFLLSYLLIGYMLNQQKKLNNTTTEELKKLKVLTILFKWWPAIYLILILVQYI